MYSIKNPETGTDLINQETGMVDWGKLRGFLANRGGPVQANEVLTPGSDAFNAANPQQPPTSKINAGNSSDVRRFKELKIFISRQLKKLVATCVQQALLKFSLGFQSKIFSQQHARSIEELHAQMTHTLLRFLEGMLLSIVDINTLQRFTAAAFGLHVDEANGNTWQWFGQIIGHASGLNRKTKNTISKFLRKKRQVNAREPKPDGGKLDRQRRAILNGLATGTISNEAAKHMVLTMIRNVAYPEAAALREKRKANEELKAELAKRRVPFLRDSIQHPTLMWLFIRSMMNENKKLSRANLESLLWKMKSGHASFGARSVTPAERAIAHAIVKSDAYAPHSEANTHRRAAENFYYAHAQNRLNDSKAVPPTTRRNATTYNGKTVSRLRKQVLKLGHGLDAAMLHLYDILYYTEYEYADLLLTDMYAVARMLYYAGYGKRKVANPSKVVVMYNGGLHTLNQRLILLALDAHSGGKLGAVEQAFRLDNSNDPHAMKITNFVSGF
jgi:hypothetical protein